MKILIAYYSNTGNTEKIANAMFQTIEKENEDIDLRKISEVNPDALKNYDILFLGSGVYASRVHKSLISLVKDAHFLPDKIVYFCTHASLKLYQDPFKKIDRILKKSDSKVIDQFDCVGDNIGISKAQKNAQIESLPKEERQKAIQNQQLIKGRPNEEDIKNSQSFAKKIINK